MKPTEIIPLFDEFLVERNLRLEAVLIGGAALAMQGVITRDTRDCDIIEPDLPAPILEAARAFAGKLSNQGEVLREDWLNNGPSQLGLILPEGWRTRLQATYHGKVITLWSPGREDFLLTKLFALCDRGLDLGDCVVLQPTREELSAAAAWVVLQDANPDWPAHVQATFLDLGRRCGHGV
jgi:hypothetical protein